MDADSSNAGFEHTSIQEIVRPLLGKGLFKGNDTEGKRSCQYARLMLYKRFITHPMMMPAAKKTKEMMSQKTPHI